MGTEAAMQIGREETTETEDKANDVAEAEVDEAIEEAVIETVATEVIVTTTATEISNTRINSARSMSVGTRDPMPDPCAPILVLALLKPLELATIPMFKIFLALALFLILILPQALLPGLVCFPPQAIVLLLIQTRLRASYITSPQSQPKHQLPPLLRTNNPHLPDSPSTSTPSRAGCRMLPSSPYHH
jgi:hypothetical protein